MKMPVQMRGAVERARIHTLGLEDAWQCASAERASVQLRTKSRDSSSFFDRVCPED